MYVCTRVCAGRGAGKLPRVCLNLAGGVQESWP